VGRCRPSVHLQLGAARLVVPAHPAQLVRHLPALCESPERGRHRGTRATARNAGDIAERVRQRGMGSVDWSCTLSPGAALAPARLQPAAPPARRTGNGAATPCTTCAPAIGDVRRHARGVPETAGRPGAGLLRRRPPSDDAGASSAAHCPAPRPPPPARTAGNVPPRRSRRSWSSPAPAPTVGRGGRPVDRGLPGGRVQTSTSTCRRPRVSRETSMRHGSCRCVQPGGVSIDCREATTRPCALPLTRRVGFT